MIEQISAWAGSQVPELLVGGVNRDDAICLIRAKWLREQGAGTWESARSIVEGEVERAYAEERRKAKKAQRDAKRVITAGRDADTPAVADVIDLNEAINRFVFIVDGGNVYDRQDARLMTQQEFVACYAASVDVTIDAQGKLKSQPVTKLWLGSRDRQTTTSVTYRPSAGVVTINPRGEDSINLWRKDDPEAAPDDWLRLAAPFLDHVSWVFGTAADQFLDWLAHIEQRPGELPHFGFLHIARNHGVGRNFIASVLGRLWPGKTAQAFDLIGSLETGYNDRLSGCHLAVVDEIYEGKASQWKHESALRKLMTEEHRHINPKYGRQRIEYNVCRFLLFSNHTGALPLDRNDRRWFVVNCDEQPKESSYYKSLYVLVDDLSFIASVRQHLRTRDLANFNPGQRPPMSEAKLATVDASRTEVDRLAIQLAESWPVDVLFRDELELLLGPDAFRATNPQALAHSLERAGIRRWPRCSGKIRTAGPSTIAYIVRNLERWADADAEALRGEQARCSLDVKEAALYGEPVRELGTAPPSSRIFRIVPVPGVPAESTAPINSCTLNDLGEKSGTVRNGNAAVVA